MCTCIQFWVSKHRQHCVHIFRTWSLCMNILQDCCYYIGTLSSVMRWNMFWVIALDISDPWIIGFWKYSTYVPSSLPTNFTLIFLERYGTLQLLFGNRPKLKKKNLKRCALMPPRSLMMMIRRRRQLHGFLIGHGCLCLEKWLKPSLKPTIIPHEGDEEDTCINHPILYSAPKSQKVQNLSK